MKSRLLPLLILPALLVGCGGRATDSGTDSDHLVILHTNDTHSAIDPDRKDLGGMARRKVLVDSVRDARSNVLLIDAGDAVQGSLYFTIFGGEVEQKLMNAMGYDIRILGNHEFDNGMASLAGLWKQVDADRLSTNYDFSGTELEGVFVPSVMKEYNGHKIGFIGINLDPSGIVAEENYKGLKYQDAVSRANEEAAKLRAEGAEMVIAVTHIGYEDETGCDDLHLASASKDIDIIIGGHSHTVIDPAKGIPAWRVANAEGDTISVLQTGSSGVNLGEIDINLADKSVKARLIPVDSRLDSRIDRAYAAQIDPYRAKVDSVKNLRIGESPREWERRSPEMLNLLSDFVRRRGAEISGKPVDLSIMNKGGIRNSLDKGPITQGEIIDIAPFDNRVVVIDLKGSDLLDNLAVMAGQDGNGVSGNVKVVYDPDTKAINTATVDGKAIDPARTYRIATIDYLANGNDYMTPLKNGVRVARSNDVLYVSLIDAITAGKLDDLMANPDTTNRMTAF